jgi:hypothetical protein
MFDSVRCAHKKNQPGGWFQCAWLALAVRAGLPSALPWGGNLLPLLALRMKTHRLAPVPFFYALSLLKTISMRPGHKKTRPFGAGFQAQCLIFSGEGGIRTRGTVTRTAV